MIILVVLVLLCVEEWYLWATTNNPNFGVGYAVFLTLILDALRDMKK